MNRRAFLFCTLAILTAGVFAFAGCGKKAGTEKEKARPAQVKAVKPEMKPVVFPENEKVLYGFEKDAQYWAMPEWALESEDYVAKSCEVAKDFAGEGSSGIKITADFPGKIWTAALVELEESLDWTPYKEVKCDIYLPEGAPEGLKARMILTVGNDWHFTEMSSPIFLVPGRWNTMSANLMPGSEDWKMTVVDGYFRKDIRKIAIRIESNKGPIYSGPIYIDNVRVVKQ